MNNETEKSGILMQQSQEIIKAIEVFVSSLVNDLAIMFNTELENKIKEAILNAGLSIDDEFVRNNLGLVMSESENFIHIFYRFGYPDQKRIFSYEKDSTISFIEKEGNSFTTEVTKKYY